MPGVMLKEVLAKVADEIKSASRSRATHAPATANAEAPVAVSADAPLTQNALWSCVKGFLKPADVIIGEAGTSHAALSSMRLPSGATYIAQPIWGAIGYTLPALFGSLVGAPSRRHVLFIGDGSFQLTAQELSSILRRDLKPVIFLLNNNGYTIERLILGERSAYNDVANWRYAELPHVLDRHDRALTLVVENLGELQAALEKAARADRLVFIELKLPMMDAPESLKKFADIFADFDYGERGPRNTAVVTNRVAQSQKDRAIDETV
jgi:indolepyruvate decarboxylase